MGREWIDSHDLALLRKAFLVRQGGNLANMEEERMPTFMDNYSGFRVPADMVYTVDAVWTAGSHPLSPSQDDARPQFGEGMAHSVAVQGCNNHKSLNDIEKPDQNRA